ncbi:MAG: hypothetical protein ACI959_001377, partial [Limisphaerales bacterium]
ASGESVSSDFNLDVLNEQLIEEWGISITTVQAGYPGGGLNADGVFIERHENNGFLEGNIVYEDASKSWLTGVTDGEGTSFNNWIGAGISTEVPADYANIDNNQIYEGVIGGTWAPGKLVLLEDPVAIGNVTPFGREISSMTALMSMNNLHSIDLVFTADKDKWTRCAVVETSPIGLSIYPKNTLKEEPSRGKDGEFDNTGLGQSWFPGYAIDLETGERVNIVMGEASWLGSSNGNDMLWNPTDEFIDPLFNTVYGGGHFIYVQGTRYDEGLEFMGLIRSTVGDQRTAWGSTMWVSMSYMNRGFQMNSIQEGLIPTTTTVRLRVSQPYAKFDVDGSNGGVNKYYFSTKELAPVVNDVATAETACDLINVVPNPYYGFSSYENSVLDNRIKITNLPPKCVVSVYALDGTLVRRFTRDAGVDNTSGGALNASTGDNFDTTLEWDLKNAQNVPVASGVYLIHVEAEGLCERTLKWLAVMRPIDVDTF